MQTRGVDDTGQLVPWHAYSVTQKSVGKKISSWGLADDLGSN